MSSPIVTRLIEQVTGMAVLLTYLCCLSEMQRLQPDNNSFLRLLEKTVRWMMKFFLAFLPVFLCFVFVGMSLFYEY